MAGRVVAFDLDNTLVHSRIDFTGLRATILERLVAAGALPSVPSEPRSRAIPEWLALAEGHDPELGAALWVVVDRFEREGMLAGTVEPDAVPTLTRLRERGDRLAVLTNNSLASAEAALERFGLRALVERIFARGVVRTLKPGGAGLAQASAELGGGETYLVGDSWIDGMAARQAGVEARFVAFRADPIDLERRGITPWATVRQLSEVPDLLGAGQAPRADG